ncbi:MAG: VWA domain-containing protein [Candidatus Yanofskybacteria bacterium]|nr:VWA domain-containing protein [Candidatus Yanofskybacteria bacterium]
MTERISEPTPEQTARREMAERIWREHGRYFESYAGTYGLEVKPSPPGLGTFAVNLEKGILYIATEWFLERGYSEAEIPAYVLHEMEHMREADALVRTHGGLGVWREHGKRCKASRRFRILDNCVDDIKMNRTVMLRAPVQTETLLDFYRRRFNGGTNDLSGAPRHLQFAYALLRLAMLPDEPVVVAPEVREALDELEALRGRSGRTALDIMTDPQVDMATRLTLQEKNVEPLFERLYERDRRERQPEKPGDSQGGEKSGGEGGGEGDDPFASEYDRFDAQNPDGALSDDALGDAVDEADASGALARPRGGQLADAARDARSAYAREHGVSESELAAYRRFYDQLTALTDPETGRTVVDGLRDVFEQIISERERPRVVPKHPVIHGHRLSRPAQAHIAARTGDRHPSVWETVERKEKKGELYGDVDVVLVCDRSGSMLGQKAIQQRLAAGLMLEALADFSELIHERASGLTDPLVVRTQTWSFGDEAVTNELKPLSDNLTERDRVAVFHALGSTPGSSTMDYEALKRIADGIDAGEQQLLRQKKLKKIIIALTDGVSSDMPALRGQIERLRGMGAVVVGVGITKDGVSAETSYAPNGLVCAEVAALPRTLADLLKKHLADLNVRR